MHFFVIFKNFDIFQVAEMISKHDVKMEVDEDGNEIAAPVEQGKNTITFDATMEYCRNIGKIIEL